MTDQLSQHPPTLPQVTAGYQSPARWPKTLGIYLLIFCLYNMVVNLVITAIPVFIIIFKNQNNWLASLFPDTISHWHYINAAASFLTCLWACIGAAAAVALMRRQHWARKRLLTWAIVFLLLAACRFDLWVVQKQTSDNHDNVIGMLNILIAISIFDFIMPVVSLFLLNIRKIKYQVNDWVQ